MGTLFINPVIYAEMSVGFDWIEELETAIQIAAFQMLEIPKEALFLEGKVFLQYKKSRGTKSSPLPDFYIGAQAAVMNLDLITRDDRYRTYFPTVTLITPWVPRPVKLSQISTSVENKGAETDFVGFSPLYQFEA